jgi:signal transduction histidine kinase
MAGRGPGPPGDEVRQSDLRLSERAQLQVLAYQLALAEDKERRRIAVGLHDHVGQLLASAKLLLDVLLAKADGASDGPTLNALGEMLDQAIWATRTLTFELSSPVLCHLGLEAALQRLGEEIEQAHGLRVEVPAARPPLPLAEEVRDLLFRVGRELLINVVKHAEARRAVVSIDRIGADVRLEVRDDGRGFDPTGAGRGVSSGGGFGLFAAQEQLAGIGGALEIASARSAGTRIVARAPLEVDDAFAPSTSCDVERDPRPARRRRA